MPPFSFYQLTIQEALLFIEGFRQQEEWQYNLDLTAHYNANGYFNVKKFKPLEPFKEQAPEANKKVSKEEYNNTLNHLKDRFKEVR
jgi:hypothetical protein